MIQNQSKLIGRADLGRIFSAASFVIYSGKTQFNLGGNRFKCGSFPLSYVFYVKGLGGGKASVIWMWDSDMQGSSPYVGRVSKFANSSNVFATDRLVKYRVDEDASTICDGLKIAENQVKILIYYIPIWTPGALWEDGTDTNDYKKLLRLFVVPLSSVQESVLVGRYYSASIIFNSKPGLFNENGP
ncbi:MAG: hypothetical protein LBB21_00285 [Holosporaceae bacterium]|nr:hypothetical protein [Holosporaceae bacterium]